MSTTMPGSTPAPGEPEPQEIRARVEAAVEKLREAMRRGEAAAIETCTQQLSEALGPWTAVPERRSRFAGPADPDTPITRARLARLWDAAWTAAMKGYRGNGRWGLPPDRPEVQHTLLRRTAYVILGCLAALRNRFGELDEIRQRLNEGLDYLLSVQKQNGLLPFPDMRGWDAHFTPPLDALYQQHPEAFENGWVIDDFGDGGLQFDNGVCAFTLISAYEQNKDARCFDAARRACTWAVGRPVVPNWNYNAFTVWALARYVQVTGDQSFLRPATEKTRLGILPGQLPNGRWLDRHNCRTVYHAIILRALATLYPVLPEDAVLRPRLRDAIERAEGTLVDELYRSGASDADHSLTALCAVRKALGESERRTGAIRIVVNAMIAQAVDQRTNTAEDTGRQAASATRRTDAVDDLTLLAVGQAIEAFD